MPAFLANMTERDRLMLKVLGLAVGLFVLLNFLVLPAIRWRSGMVDELEEKSERLVKYQAIVERSETIKARKDAAEKLKSRLSTFFLPGDTPELSSAELSKIVKDIASKHQVTIERITPKTNKDFENFTLITVSFPAIGSTGNFKDFLYDLEYHQRLLMVQEARIRPRRRRGIHELYADMTVTGVIRKPAAATASSPEKAN